MRILLLGFLVINLFACNNDVENTGIEKRDIGVTRLTNGPIIHPALDASLSDNIQGPSLIKVPTWLPNPLGKYYLYFADHKGQSIGLAYADTLAGPWNIHQSASLRLQQTDFAQTPPEVSTLYLWVAKIAMRFMGMNPNDLPHDLTKELTTPHIASPDVHVDEKNQRVVMYFHGLKDVATQQSRVALSKDGINFTAQTENLGKTYMRIFEHNGQTHALAMPGQFYRSADGLTNFEAGPKLFNRDMRHSAVYKKGNTLYVFWTQVGHVPERILLSTIDLTAPWMQWQASEPVEVLRPQQSWEGANAPLVPSRRSVVYGQANQLRDPAIYNENGELYLLYAVAGESGIAIARIDASAL